VVSGWVLFLPGVLDRFKFTDGLVGHSFTAMAGFVSALLIFAMVQLLGEDGWIFTRTWSFNAWNGGVLGYVVVMMVAGWLESSDPAFTIVPGMVRNLLYVLRLVTGLLMLAASLDWFVDASSLLRESTPIAPHVAREEIA
jgi:cytochrome c oxidase cbb3-type subunit 1